MRALVGAMLLPVVVATLQAADPRIRVVGNESARRVDVTIDGKPFTSYIWPATIMKPVLYPLRTATGALVTRGFPLDPRKGERVDHPHHVGLWFNHGDVNGFDFWNNSDAIAKDQAVKMGTIHHKRIVNAKSGDDRGELSVEAEWVSGEGTALLREQTQFVFRGSADTRVIDRYTTLTALDQKVVLRDNKESTLGIRLARELEQPSNQPEVFTDASGKATTVPVLDNTGVTGEYVSSEGKKGDAVWGTRGKWTLVGGRIGSEPISIAILDHPANFGYPTHWHARGYGLFAANPLGQKALGDGNEELNLILEPGKSATFRYRVMILNGTGALERVAAESKKFAGEHF
jgi:Methane oxygenase PmoA